MANGAPTVAAAITALSLAVSFSAFFAGTASAADAPPSPPYTNHTVGDSAGWFFNSTSNSSVTNYSNWASAQNFFLGDYLIFNTDSSNTVIQTFNATTYALCNFTDDNGQDTTFYYDGGSGGATANVTVAVPLTQKGASYFFSAADGGADCLQGMRFQITVAHGRGLPPSLNQPPPPPYVDPVRPPAPDIMVTPTPIASRGEKLHSRAPLTAVLWVGFVGVLFLLSAA